MLFFSISSQLKGKYRQCLLSLPCHCNFTEGPVGPLTSQPLIHLLPHVPASSPTDPCVPSSPHLPPRQRPFTPAQDSSVSFHAWPYCYPSKWHRLPRYPYGTSAFPGQPCLPGPSPSGLSSLYHPRPHHIKVTAFHALQPPAPPALSTALACLSLLSCSHSPCFLSRTEHGSLRPAYSSSTTVLLQGTLASLPPPQNPSSLPSWAHS